MPELSMSEAADELGVSPATVRGWIRSGLLPAHRVGPKLVRIERADLAALVAPVETRAAP